MQVRGRSAVLATLAAVHALVLASCGATVRSVTDAPLSLRHPAPSDASFSGLMVYSDVEGEHLPPRAKGIEVRRRVVLSRVACERRSEDWGPATWSCRRDDTEPTPEERLVTDRAAACFRMERREASSALLESLASDRRGALASLPETSLVLVRRTQINRTAEVRPIGCEGAQGQPCDPVGAEKTGRTLEQITRSREIVLVGPGAPPDPYLRSWPFPAWRADVAYAPIELPGLSFAPGDTLTKADARDALERLSAVDASGRQRAVRLSLVWDVAVLAFKLGDHARGERALAAAETELRSGPTREPIDATIARGAPFLHALLDGTVSLTDPCRPP